MVDFAAARQHMVDSQIRTNKVTDPRIIEAFEAVPREQFVGDVLRGIAYVDEDLEVAPRRFLMEPMVLARMVQAVQPEPGDMILDLGCATGYSTAVLAGLAETVVGLDHDHALVEQANATLNALDLDNAVVVEGALQGGYAKQAPYNVILLQGAVNEVPAAIKSQMAEGGRLAAVVLDETGIGRATLIERSGEIFSTRKLFDAAVPLLPGFEREAGFVF
ncbi:protein-L-isoaspartate O-methyltransferase [Pelagibius sp.]|uniref:protein-L-isoaspartate O-methyltransferase family protein n=1 Tax=Pelagibius sp. TaxID=1931238 RepID=UPI0026221B69|nr:protein-L-isoaspartate O-methyltransferase [Pelagibius sp.]